MNDTASTSISSRKAPAPSARAGAQPKVKANASAVKVSQVRAAGKEKNKFEKGTRVIGLVRLAGA